VKISNYKNVLSTYLAGFSVSNTAGVRARLCKLQKGCTRLATASDKVYQLLAHGRWFSPGTPASSTTKTGRHDIAKKLLKVALSTLDQIKSNHYNVKVILNVRCLRVKWRVLY
jgi:hypothetical protein